MNQHRIPHGTADSGDTAHPVGKDNSEAIHQLQDSLQHKFPGDLTFSTRDDGTIEIKDTQGTVVTSFTVSDGRFNLYGAKHDGMSVEEAVAAIGDRYDCV